MYLFHPLFSAECEKHWRFYFGRYGASARIYVAGILPLPEHYRELVLADVSPEQRFILKGRGRLLVDTVAAEL